MNMNQPRYITTTLPYVNADPHIGFAYEVTAADALARHWRLLGHEVFFNTGTDEHGQKIANKADENGKDRQLYVDHYAHEFKKLADKITGLDLSFDNFVRTTDVVHKKAAAAIWKRCLAKGDIYKKKYSGLYCVGCELFYKESELLSGHVCPIHDKPAVEIEEENYFFKLSNYQEYLETYLADEGVIEPEWRRQEAINFVKAGLEDFSISRERSRLNWGVPVPDDEDQVMYVWFDALTNYISTLGWPEDNEGNFRKFWTNGNVLQLAGKDQVRFQSVIWQAMLKSADLKATDKVIYHGFINSGGQKMSKSLGNVISPYELIARFGVDATRFLLLRHVDPYDDSDITWERLDEWYTADLVNGLGNLTARIMKMSETHLENNEYALGKITTLPVEYLNIMSGYELQAACDFIWKLIGSLDERIAVEEPFKLIKNDREKALTIIQELVADLNLVGHLLLPLMPETAAVITESIMANKKPDNLFKRLEA